MIMQKIKATAWKAFLSLIDRPLKAPTAHEQSQMIQLRTTFSVFQNADETVSSEAEKVWNENLNRLKNLVLKEDPRGFLRWDVVREAMFVGNASYIAVELSYLQTHKEWSTRWEAAIEETIQGCPTPYYRYLKSSGNLIHHAYHLARFEEETGLRIDSLKCIFEFGGGYGSMCRLAHRLGFRGKYVIFDLPHFSCLQSFYLASLGLDVKTKEQLGEATGIFCVDTLKDVELAQIGGTNSVFIATWSFSETPLYIREQLLPQISLSDSHLIAYQDYFGEVDNVDYFARQPEFNANLNLINEKIAHLPGSRYLFGWGKKN